MTVITLTVVEPMDEYTENPLYTEDLYARGRADWAAGDVDEALWVASEHYRAGLADERSDQVDTELLRYAAERAERDTR